jgi:hypothetical protein
MRLIGRRCTLFGKGAQEEAGAQADAEAEKR